MWWLPVPCHLPAALFRSAVEVAHIFPHIGALQRGSGITHGGLKRLSAASSTGSALLELLGRYWLTKNEGNLPKLLPYLIALRQEIVESRPVEEQKEPRRTEFVYPLF